MFGRVMGKQARKNLVVTRAGSRSLHAGWLAGGPRNFDLIVTAYDERAMAADADGVAHIFLPGSKVDGFRRFFSQHAELLECYETIALLDDDIDTDAATLSECFEIGVSRNLDLWQPSLSWDSYVTFGGTLRNPSFSLRFVNFVEMMCPFFRMAYFKQILPLFSLRLESGIDLIWCSFGDREHSCAIIDDVSVRHTRRVGRQKAANGFVDRSYEFDIHRCLELFSAQWPSLVAVQAIDRQGRYVRSRLRLGVHTLSVVPSLVCAPADHRKERVINLSIHLRHQWTRRPNYVEDARATLARLVNAPLSRAS